VLACVPAPGTGHHPHFLLYFFLVAGLVIVVLALLVSIYVIFNRRRFFGPGNGGDERYEPSQGDSSNFTSRGVRDALAASPQVSLASSSRARCRLNDESGTSGGGGKGLRL
jgi:hypothetical protein